MSVVHRIHSGQDLALLDEEMRTFFGTCQGGTPEAPLVQWALDLYGRPGGLFVDAGAHVGSWSLPFSQIMRVEAFEPNPTIRALLEETVAMNNASVFVHEEALSNFRSSATLTAPGADGGMGSIVINYTGPVAVSVQTVQLDDYELAPDLIKVDVEGAEVDLLRGAKDTLERYHPVILFECWEQERGQRKIELLGFLQGLGYKTDPTWWPEMWVATWNS